MTITADQRAYYWLNIVGGWIILPIIILTTLLSRRTRKSPLLMNLYYIWTYEALLAALLFVTNKYSLEKDHVLVPRIQDSDPLCIAQAVMFEGASPQMSAANLCVVLNVFLIMRSITRSTTVVNPMVTYALVLYPHLCYLAVLVPFIIIAVKNPGKTSPHQFYCTIDLGYASMLSGVTTVANTILAVSLQTWILVVLRREHRKVFSRTGLNSSIILRVLLFTTIQLIAVILAIITLNDFTAVTPDIMVASSPILVALIFGTQQDVINAWYSLLTTHPLVTLDTWWNASSHSQSGSNSRSHSQSQSQSRSKSQSQSQTQHSRRVRSMSMPDDAPHPTSSRRSGAPRPFKFTPGRSEPGLESVVEEINLPTYPPTSASVQKLRPREANNPNDGLMDFFEMMDKSRIPGIPRRSNSAPGTENRVFVAPRQTS
ncbi:hypothetical protein DL93DRAFT_358423 [Clavulina sp. PMI_390]|nr:hypothetical protein DL93DRAFT_358423 [Clavulina sp. PMI_390]